VAGRGEDGIDAVAEAPLELIAVHAVLSLDVADGAVRPDQDDEAAERLDAAPDPAIAGAPAHDVSNALRGHLAELGIVSAKGRNGTAELLRIITVGADSRVSTAVRGILEMLARQYGAIGAEIASSDKSTMALHRGCEASRRLAEIPDMGPPPRLKRRVRQHIPPRRQLTPRATERRARERPVGWRGDREGGAHPFGVIESAGPPCDGWRASGITSMSMNGNIGIEVSIACSSSGSATLKITTLP
jgi:hypothetical protein